MSRPAQSLCLGRFLPEGGGRDRPLTAGTFSFLQVGGSLCRRTVGFCFFSFALPDACLPTFACSSILTPALSCPGGTSRRILLPPPFLGGQGGGGAEVRREACR